MIRFRFSAPAIVISLLMLPIVAHAQWKLDGAQLTSDFMHEFEQDVISDGNGGFIVAWRDGNTFSYRIHVQRVNALGVKLWAPGGVVLTNVSEQGVPKLVADGAGGAIVTWHDLRNGYYDIYAQRVNGAGVPQWTAGGVAICLDPQSQQNPRIVSDFAGGAIIAWEDNRHGTFDFYAQRINASGVVQWTANGRPMFVDAYYQDGLAMVANGFGGAMLVWLDYQFADTRVVGARVNSSGVVLDAPALVVCSAPGNKYEATITSDGSNGAIVAWVDNRSGVGGHVYAQRIASSGFLWWDADGIPVATVSYTSYLDIVADGAGGAIVSWSDFRNGVDNDIYAQRLIAYGDVHWPTNGVALGMAPGNQLASTVIPDGTGGAIVAWMDQRTGTVFPDIYANRVNGSGATMWAFGGIPLSTAVATQRDPVAVSDGAEGAIVVWEDYRGGGNSNLYAQRIEKRGYWGRPEPLVETANDVPGDQGGKVAVNWIASGQDAYDLQVVSHYSVWRATDVEPAVAAAMVSSAEEVGPDFQGAAFRRDVDAAGDEYYWEWVGNQAAIYSPRYSFSASTRSDSTSQSSADHYFQVLAHTWNNFVSWTSNVVSGRSVDNLAPAPPFFLIAQRVGADVHLRWNRVRVPDMKNYRVYRAASPGVTPITPNFIAMGSDTVLVDENVPTTSLYYIVTANDVHGNQSLASNELSAATGIGDAPALTALTVMQNHPNPFTGSTDLQIGLPRESDVSIEVFDVAGRRVRTQSMSRQSAGWNRIAFDGRSDAGRPLASGVYFYRVTANGSTVTRKMVIAR